MTTGEAMEIEVHPGHPRILVRNDQREALREKIATHAWAKTVYDRIFERVTPYVERHKTDPEWIVSRLAMHWKTHYTRTFVEGERWSHGAGRAPVPTPMFAGARDWATDYRTPSLEDMRPYHEDERGLWLQNRAKDGEPWEWAHPGQTGQIIEHINERIADLAEDAAFVYWLTGDKAYAAFAADILWTYMEGLSHRANPETVEPHRVERIIGIATFEVIHERITQPLSTTYDFLHDYLEAQDRDLAMIQSVFKRWMDRIIEGGSGTGNWNINQARFIVYMALALEPDAAYDDGRGAEYYLSRFTHVSEENQSSLKDVIPAEYDQASGVWPEAPGYAFSVTNNILRLSEVVHTGTGLDLMAAYPLVVRASLVMFQYLFPNGLTVGFGDTYHQSPDPDALELLVARARRVGDTNLERSLTSALRRQMAHAGYKRDRHGSIEKLVGFVGELVDVKDAPQLSTRTFHAKPVELLVQRNGEDRRTGLMASVTGTGGGHAHANGMSLELYGRGWVLGPDAGRGASYWVPEHGEYYREYPAHNTVIVDGASDYSSRSTQPLAVAAIDPPVESTSPVSPSFSFSDTRFFEPKTASDQRRVVAVIRTSDSTGYYVDMFQSKKRDGEAAKHEYLFHGLGLELVVEDGDGEPLVMTPSETLGSAHGDLIGYDYFEDERSAKHDGDFEAEWRVEEAGNPPMRLWSWHAGAEGREVLQVMAPRARTIREGSGPRYLLEAPMPTLVVRKAGNAWMDPFVAVYEPYDEAGKAITSVEALGRGGEQAWKCLTVTSRVGSDVVRDRIYLSMGDVGEIEEGGVSFVGRFGVVRERNGEIDDVYVGDGMRLGVGELRAESRGERVAFSVRREVGVWVAAATGDVVVTFGGEPVPVSRVDGDGR